MDIICKAPWRIVWLRECRKNATFQAFGKKAAFGNILPIFIPVILNFELVQQLLISKVKSIGLDHFLKWQKMVQMSIFPGLIALEVVWQRSHAQRYDMQRRPRDSHINNLPRCLIVCDTWYYLMELMLIKYYFVSLSLKHACIELMISCVIIWFENPNLKTFWFDLYITEGYNKHHKMHHTITKY